MSTGDIVRRRTTQKDNMIRKKVEAELQRKKNAYGGPGSPSPTLNPSLTPKKGSKVGMTVATLRPHPAITIGESAKVVEAGALISGLVYIVNTNHCNVMTIRLTFYDYECVKKPS